MKKTCVLVCGTNRSGKSTTAKAVLEKFGAKARRNKAVWVSDDHSAAYIGADYTHCTTSVIPGMVKNLLEEVDVVIVEGMYLGTFGTNCLTTLHQAPRQLYVFLYADTQTLLDRAQSRPLAKGDPKKILQGQHQCFEAAKKYANLGIPTLVYNTATLPVEEIASEIYENINHIGGGGKLRAKQRSTFEHGFTQTMG